MRTAMMSRSRSAGRRDESTFASRKGYHSAMLYYLGFLFIVSLVVFIGVRSPWSWLWWVPVTAGSLATMVYLIFYVDDGMPMPTGPGGGGEGIYFLGVSAARAVAALVFLACLIAYPRRPT